MTDQEPFPFPYEIKELEAHEKAKIKKLYSPPWDYVRVGPKGFLVNRTYLKDAANMYNMPLRSSDIFVTTYPRSGTTWTQEMVWLLANNLDYATAASVPLVQRFPCLEYFMYIIEDAADTFIKRANNFENSELIKQTLEKFATPTSRQLATAPSPRFIKTHLPKSLLPPKMLDTAKVVYIGRDPRDVAVSSYHHTKLFKLFEFNGDFKDFWNLFINDLYILTPYFEQVKEAWEQRNNPNMLFLFYEELSKDLPATIRRVAEFLNKELTAVDIDRLCEHLKFDNFKNNKSVNSERLREYGLLAEDETFIRKGKAGGWHGYFDAEMTRQAEHWIADNLRDTDLRFPHVE